MSQQKLSFLLHNQEEGNDLSVLLAELCISKIPGVVPRLHMFHDHVSRTRIRPAAMHNTTDILALISPSAPLKTTED
jgi:hypothetical protein